MGEHISTLLYSQLNSALVHAWNVYSNILIYNVKFPRESELPQTSLPSPRPSLHHTHSSCIFKQNSHAKLNKSNNYVIQPTYFKMNFINVFVDGLRYV